MDRFSLIMYVLFLQSDQSEEANDFLSLYLQGF